MLLAIYFVLLQAKNINEIKIKKAHVDREKVASMHQSSFNFT